MREIVPCDDEFAGLALSESSSAAAVEALLADGCVVLANVIDVEHIERIRERMIEDLDVILGRDDRQVNFTPGHLQHKPPPFAPFLYQDVIANPFVVGLTRTMLGRGVQNVLYSGNTNLPESVAQPVHADEPSLWSKLATAHPAVGLAVNVAIVDTDESNGSMEIWPGSHLDTAHCIWDESPFVPSDHLEARRTFAPPERANMRSGSIMIRDLRAWHRGMPNLSSAPRPMLAMLHRPKWWRPWPVEFGLGSESVLAESGLVHNEVIVEALDYLGQHGPD